MDDINRGRVLPIFIETEMRQSYMDYAMSVIVARALPDVRDGLKPVHRRILYAMHQMGLTSGARYRKSAGIIGEVLKNFHPHGDVALYDTLVRMAQDFALRYPLVDGQGNFGSVDGDSAAAMRYTEARTTAIAEELLADIDKNTVEFRDNYDANMQEPTILPGKVPNLLINGSSGIAVGMTTNIPPHNLSEVVDGLIYLIDHPDAATDDLTRFIKGPDFPTGGIIFGKEGISSTYGTGHGRIVVRGRVEFELSNNGRERIIVTELPYQVNKASLVAKIAELVGDRKLEGIADLNDESDREGMRIVIELKKDARPHNVLANLYKHTALQSTFGAIMLALVDGRPLILPLKAMMQHYVDHRRQVVRRRTQFELDKARDRAHILEGLKICLDHLDEVIKTIRAAKDPAIAESELIRKFQLTERQAKAILELRLQRLTQLERGKIQDEYEEMIKRIAYLEDILAHEAKVLYLIKEELLELKKKYGDDRRTEIRSDGTGELNEEDLIPKEDVVVTLTHKGYCKRVPITAYRAQRRGGKGVTGMGTREADYVEHLCITNTHSEMLFFTQRGRVFRLRVHEIPDVSRQAKGLPIINLIEIDTEEKVTAALTLPAFTEDQYLIMVTRQGQIKKTPARAYEQVRRNGLIAIALTDKDELDWVQVSSGADEILIASTDGKAVRFSEKQVRPMGRDTQGVRGIRLRPKAEVAGMDILRKDAHVLVVSERGYGKLTPIDDYPAHGRGGQGVFTLNVTPRVGKLVGLRVVQDLEEELMVISTQGIVIRTRLADIRISGRQTQGVIIMRLDEGDTVASIAGVGNRESVEEQ